jgi:hypothetical protein
MSTVRPGDAGQNLTSLCSNRAFTARPATTARRGSPRRDPDPAWSTPILSLLSFCLTMARALVLWRIGVQP